MLLRGGQPANFLPTRPSDHPPGTGRLVKLNQHRLPAQSRWRDDRQLRRNVRRACAMEGGSTALPSAPSGARAARWRCRGGGVGADPSRGRGQDVPWGAGDGGVDCRVQRDPPATRCGIETAVDVDYRVFRSADRRCADPAARVGSGAERLQGGFRMGVAGGDGDGGREHVAAGTPATVRSWPTGSMSRTTTHSAARRNG
jgi:hypothetical protein